MARSIIFLGFCFSTAVFIYVGIPWICARWLQMLLKLKTSKLRAIVLTFDDGPGNRLTPAILELLAIRTTKATFFLLGRNIAGREEIVRQIAEQGHEICSHGYNHLNHWKVAPILAIKDIKQGWKAIDEVLGTERGKYPFRPPDGKLNIISLLYLLFCRVPIVYWSVDSGDTWRIKPSPQRIAFEVERNGGMVSLAHDFDRSDASVDFFVMESVKSTLAIARKSKLHILTVSELLNSAG